MREHEFPQLAIKWSINIHKAFKIDYTYPKKYIK